MNSAAPSRKKASISQGTAFPFLRTVAEVNSIVENRMKRPMTTAAESVKKAAIMPVIIIMQKDTTGRL